MIDSYKKGVTIVEIIIGIAIIISLIAVILPRFSSMRENQTLKSAVSDVVSVISKAQSQSFSSIDSSEYGVYFDTNSVVLFKGTSYNSSDSNNESFSLTQPATISDISLTGGATSLYFDRLSGEPTKSGTITISTTSFSKIITISATGTVSVN